MMPLNTISNDIMKNSVEKKIDDEILKQKYLDNKNIARAGIRWQVFERDDFKCVACGASAQDGAILHVDHIIPRSKGGEDIMENYQTLCHLCNIGKSNKSNKNLRKGEKSDP
jgi:5-methylcytosine-specific restriction endonuclease McrA